MAGKHVRSRSNYVKVHAEGVLIPWIDKASTIVEARVRILPKTYWVNVALLFVLGFGLVGIALVLRSQLICLLPIILFVSFSFMMTTLFQTDVTSEYRRQQLIEQLYAVFKE